MWLLFLCLAFLGAHHSAARELLDFAFAPEHAKIPCTHNVTDAAQVMKALQSYAGKKLVLCFIGPETCVSILGASAAPPD
jgi:hypothetical protein